MMRWGVALLAALLFSLTCTASDWRSPAGQSLLKARRAFINAEKAKDWKAVTRAIWTFQLTGDDAEAVKENFLRQVEADAEAGVQLQKEQVLALELHRDRGFIFAAMKTRDTLANPVNPHQPRQLQSMAYALSRDDGKTWKFNVLGCLGSPQIATLFPRYRSKFNVAGG